MSSLSDKTGGPAFPHDKYMKNGDQWGTYAHGGMSLRDYFAAAAMTGLCSGQHWPMASDGEEMARRCFIFADAMIAARLLDAASSEAVDQ